MKLSKQLSGIAGEYYVAAELSRRGYLAAITLRNSDGVDILASNESGEKTFSVQVKTTQNKRKWILGKKVEEDKAVNKFYVFVNIPNDLNSLPEYYIVKAIDLSKNIYEGHRNWLKETGKNGRIRKDSNARQFDPRYFSDSQLLNWEKLLSIFEE